MRLALICLAGLFSFSSVFAANERDVGQPWHYVVINDQPGMALKDSHNTSSDLEDGLEAKLNRETISVRTHYLASYEQGFFNYVDIYKGASPDSIRKAIRATPGFEKATAYTLSDLKNLFLSAIQQKPQGWPRESDRPVRFEERIVSLLPTLNATILSGQTKRWIKSLSNAELADIQTYIAKDLEPLSYLVARAVNPVNGFTTNQLARDIAMKRKELAQLRDTLNNGTAIMLLISSEARARAMKLPRVPETENLRHSEEENNIFLSATTPENILYPYKQLQAQSLNAASADATVIYVRQLISIMTKHLKRTVQTAGKTQKYSRGGLSYVTTKGGASTEVRTVGAYENNIDTRLTFHYGLQGYISFASLWTSKALNQEQKQTIRHAIAEFLTLAANSSAEISKGFQEQKRREAIASMDRMNKGNSTISEKDWADMKARYIEDEVERESKVEYAYSNATDVISGLIYYTVSLKTESAEYQAAIQALRAILKDKSLSSDAKKLIAKVIFSTDYQLQNEREKANAYGDLTRELEPLLTTAATCESQLTGR